MGTQLKKKIEAYYRDLLAELAELRAEDEKNRWVYNLLEEEILEQRIVYLKGWTEK